MSGHMDRVRARRVVLFIQAVSCVFSAFCVMLMVDLERYWTAALCAYAFVVAARQRLPDLPGGDR